MVTQAYNLRLLNPINTAQTWATLNPILFKNEIGFESDTGRFKIGDGIKSWQQLPYSRSSLNELKAGNGLTILDNIIETNLQYRVIEVLPNE